MVISAVSASRRTSLTLLRRVHLVIRPCQVRKRPLEKIVDALHPSRVPVQQKHDCRCHPRWSHNTPAPESLKRHGVQASTQATMARQAPQPSRYMGGEDFSDALDGVYGDAEDLGDEGNNEIAADAPDVPPSSLVPPEPSRIKIPPPGAPAERYRLVSNTFLTRGNCD